MKTVISSAFSADRDFKLKPFNGERHRWEDFARYVKMAGMKTQRFPWMPKIILPESMNRSQEEMGSFSLQP